MAREEYRDKIDVGRAQQGVDMTGLGVRETVAYEENGKKVLRSTTRLVKEAGPDSEAKPGVEASAS